MVGGNRSRSRWDQSVWLAHPPFDNRMFVFRFISKVPWICEIMKYIIAAIVLPVALAIVVCLHFYPNVLKK
jgi:hypothetical protein